MDRYKYIFMVTTKKSQFSGFMALEVLFEQNARFGYLVI